MREALLTKTKMNNKWKVNFVKNCFLWYPRHLYERVFQWTMTLLSAELYERVFQWTMTLLSAELYERVFQWTMTLLSAELYERVFQWTMTLLSAELYSQLKDKIMFSFTKINSTVHSHVLYFYAYFKNVCILLLCDFYCWSEVLWNEIVRKLPF